MVTVKVILSIVILEKSESRSVAMAIKGILSLFEFITRNIKCMSNLNEPEKSFYKLSASGLRPACLLFGLVQKSK